MNWEERKKWLWRDDPVAQRDPVARAKSRHLHQAGAEPARNDAYSDGQGEEQDDDGTVVPFPPKTREALAALMQAAALGEEDPFGPWAMRARDAGADDDDVEAALDGGREWRRRALEQLEIKWQGGGPAGTAGKG